MCSCFNVNINLPIRKFRFIHRLFRQTDTRNWTTIKKKSTQGDEERMFSVSILFR
jgi:hypothetical protein